MPVKPVILPCYCFDIWRNVVYNKKKKDIHEHPLINDVWMIIRIQILPPPLLNWSAIYSYFISLSSIVTGVWKKMTWVTAIYWSFRMEKSYLYIDKLFPMIDYDWLLVQRRDSLPTHNTFNNISSVTHSFTMTRVVVVSMQPIASCISNIAQWFTLDVLI
jgi:hypothetical protein